MTNLTCVQHSFLTIDPAHNGPARSGHGGVAGGRFAALVDSARATVRFVAPIPLGEPMESVRVADGVTVVGPTGPVATVQALSAPLRTGHFGRLTRNDVAVAEDRWLDRRGGDHVAPTCFACGPMRTDTIGLGLRPGPVPESSLFATAWRPEIAGDVPDWMVWAALDCPTGIPALAEVDVDQAVVTAQLSVDIRGPVRGDGDYQLVSRRTGGEGRKHVTEAALVDAQGRSVAVATALWVTVPLDVTQPDRRLAESSV